MSFINLTNSITGQNFTYQVQASLDVRDKPSVFKIQLLRENKTEESHRHDPVSIAQELVIKILDFSSYRVSNLSPDTNLVINTRLQTLDPNRFIYPIQDIRPQALSVKNLVSPIRKINIVAFKYFPEPSLFDLIRKKILKDPFGRRVFANQLCSLIHEMHQKSLVHYDIKPENLLYNEKKGKLRLIDFDFARPTDHNEKPIVMGSLPYMAPEILYNRFLARHQQTACGLDIQEKDFLATNQKADCWSLLATLFTTFTVKMLISPKQIESIFINSPPRTDYLFDTEEMQLNIFIQIKSIVQAAIKKAVDENILDEQLAKFFYQNLQVDEKRRPDTETILQRINEAFSPEEEGSGSSCSSIEVLPFLEEDSSTSYTSSTSSAERISQACSFDEREIQKG